MGYQESIFLNGEGNAWFHRNKHKTRADEVVPLLLSEDISPQYVLEFGCADGWRLQGISEAFPDARCYGVDPSQDAIYRGVMKHRNVQLGVGTANSNPHTILDKVDLIIYGFCLYVCDPQELTKIVAMGDNMLLNEGHLVIHDFDPEYTHKVPYHHEPGLFSWKMDYSKLWLAYPQYSLVKKIKPDEETAVWLLKKDIGAGWPES